MVLGLQQVEDFQKPNKHQLHCRNPRLSVFLIDPAGHVCAYRASPLSPGLEGSSPERLLENGQLAFEASRNRETLAPCRVPMGV